MDGRYPASIITTAGGDAAEFMLALRILNNQYGLPMNQYVVSTIFRNYMSTMAKDEPLRQFYMHTDLHAWQHLTTYNHFDFTFLRYTSLNDGFFLLAVR